MQASIASGVKPISALVASARPDKPMLYWSFAASGVATINTTGHALPALNNVGSPSFSGGGLVLNDSAGLEYATADNNALRAVFDLQEGVWLFWANASLAGSGANPQDTLLSVHSGVGNGGQVGFNCFRSTSWRPDVFLGFDDMAAPEQYAGGSNEFAATTPTNICMLVDNTPGGKQLYRYVDGVSKIGSSWAGKGTLSYDTAATLRVRIGCNSAGTAQNFVNGTVRRMGCARLPAVPSNIAAIVQSLHQHNCAPTRELLLALQ